MKSTTLTVAAAAMVIFVKSAEAREHHHGHRNHHAVASRSTSAKARSTANGLFAFAAANLVSSTAYRGRDQTRPAAWCGWQMRHLVGADPGSSFNLARNWTHWGRPGPAGIGAVVVWPHHVGKIVGQQNGEWVIESGNDGHALRIRPRSIVGAIAIRWGS